MDYLAGLNLAAILPPKKPEQFLERPQDSNLDYRTWKNSDEAEITLALLFKNTANIELTRSLIENDTICLVLRKSGFAERTETIAYATTGKSAHTSYKKLTTEEAESYRHKKRDLVDILRKKAQEAALTSIRDAAAAAYTALYAPIDCY